MAEPIFKTVGILNVQFGERVKVVQPTNVYGCIIGDDCFIGPFVEIQKDVFQIAQKNITINNLQDQIEIINDDINGIHKKY